MKEDGPGKCGVRATHGSRKHLEVTPLPQIGRRGAVGARVRRGVFGCML